MSMTWRLFTEKWRKKPLVSLRMEQKGNLRTNNSLRVSGRPSRFGHRPWILWFPIPAVSLTFTKKKKKSQTINQPTLFFFNSVRCNYCNHDLRNRLFHLSYKFLLFVCGEQTLYPTSHPREAHRCNLTPAIKSESFAEGIFQQSGSVGRRFRPGYLSFLSGVSIHHFWRMVNINSAFLNSFLQTALS